MISNPSARSGWLLSFASILALVPTGSSARDRLSKEEAKRELSAEVQQIKDKGCLTQDSVDCSNAIERYREDLILTNASNKVDIREDDAIARVYSERTGEENPNDVADRRAAQMRAINQQTLGMLVGGISSIIANHGRPPMSMPTPTVPVPIAPSYTAPNVVGPRTIATRPSTNAAFGALPAGIGTDAQRNFWASRCQNQAKDGSPAAQGCEQALSNFQHQPTKPVTAPLTPLPTPGAVFQSAGGPHAATAVHCVSMRPQVGGLGFWDVVNGCPYDVIGRFWYDGVEQTMSAAHHGGFGPIRPGGTEQVSPPARGTSAYHTQSCKYDEWNSGYCRFP